MEEMQEAAMKCGPDGLPRVDVLKAVADAKAKLTGMSLAHLKLKTVLNLPAAVAKGLNLPITPFRPPPKEDAARKAAAAARKAAAAAAAAPAATSPPTVPAPFSRVDAGAGAGLRLTASPMFAKLVHPKTGALVDLPAATETSPHQLLVMFAICWATRARARSSPRCNTKG